MPPANIRRVDYTARVLWSPVMKVVIVILLLAVIISLFSGLFFLFKDKGQSDRMVKALTIRVGLSIGIFVLLMAGYYFGIIPGH